MNIGQFIFESDVMMNTEIANRIKKIISAQLNIPMANICYDAKFHANLGLDSLDVVNLIAGINMEFAIRLTENDIIDVETIAALADRVELRLNETCN